MSTQSSDEEYLEHYKEHDVGPGIRNESGDVESYKENDVGLIKEYAADYHTILLGGTREVTQIPKGCFAENFSLFEAMEGFLAPSAPPLEKVVEGEDSARSNSTAEASHGEDLMCETSSFALSESIEQRLQKIELEGIVMARRLDAALKINMELQSANMVLQEKVEFLWDGKERCEESIAEFSSACTRWPPHTSSSCTRTPSHGTPRQNSTERQSSVSRGQPAQTIGAAVPEAVSSPFVPSRGSSKPATKCYATEPPMQPQTLTSSPVRSGVCCSSVANGMRSPHYPWTPPLASVASQSSASLRSVSPTRACQFSQSVLGQGQLQRATRAQAHILKPPLLSSTPLAPPQLSQSISDLQTIGIAEISRQPSPDRYRTRSSSSGAATVRMRMPAQISARDNQWSACLDTACGGQKVSQEGASQRLQTRQKSPTRTGSSGLTPPQPFGAKSQFLAPE